MGLIRSSRRVAVALGVWMVFAVAVGGVAGALVGKTP